MKIVKLKGLVEVVIYWNDCCLKSIAQSYLVVCKNKFSISRAKLFKNPFKVKHFVEMENLFLYVA